MSDWTDEHRPTEMNQEVMNEDDIHDFGIDVVAEYSKKMDLKSYPSIKTESTIRRL